MSVIKVVLDTNVIVSAHLNAKGYEAMALDLALAGKLRLCVGAAILTEYEEVLRRPRFGFDPKLIAASMRLIKAKAVKVRPTWTVAACPDPDDNKFLECAEAAGAEYVVTGNKRHFPKSWGHARIVNARELIQLITPDLYR